MYEDILLPTDGSVGMASAIKHCLHLASLHDATVHALYVVDVRAYMLLADGTKERVMELLWADGETALGALEAHVTAEGISLTTRIQEGVPQEAILQYVQDNDIDLIVMGTHGQTGEANRIVGSVAEEVVRNATVPVLTVRASDADLPEVESAILPKALEEIPEEQRRYIR